MLPPTPPPARSARFCLLKGYRRLLGLSDSGHHDAYGSVSRRGPYLVITSFSFGLCSQSLTVKSAVDRVCSWMSTRMPCRFAIRCCLISYKVTSSYGMAYMSGASRQEEAPWHPSSLSCELCCACRLVVHPLVLGSIVGEPRCSDTEEVKLLHLLVAVTAAALSCLCFISVLDQFMIVTAASRPPAVLPVAWFCQM